MELMSPTENITDVGVVIGRFQVHELHEGHIDLIRTVADRHAKVIVALGIARLSVTRQNPLDFQSREQMIRELVPNATLIGVPDLRDDKLWSKKLDEEIALRVSPGQTVTLYGGRESFMPHYHGRHCTVGLTHKQERYFSGSKVRDALRKSVVDSADFRAGVIWAAHNQYPKVVPTVDVAIMDDENENVLLARKPGEEKYRFVGGYADVNSDSYESDARREVSEETGLAITDPMFLGSFKIDDWRYAGEPDTIRTTLFIAKKMFGSPTPMDDIEELRWFLVSGIEPHMIVPEHHVLMRAFLTHFNYNVNGWH